MREGREDGERRGANIDKGLKVILFTSVLTILLVEAWFADDCICLAVCVVAASPGPPSDSASSVAVLPSSSFSRAVDAAEAAAADSLTMSLCLSFCRSTSLLACCFGCGFGSPLGAGGPLPFPPPPSPPRVFVDWPGLVSLRLRSNAL